MKKLLSLFFVGALVVAGCSSSNNEPQTPEAPEGDVALKDGTYTAKGAGYGAMLRLL